MRSARSIAAPATAKMISAVVLELTRCAEAGDDLLDSPDPLEGWAGGDGTLAGDAGAPCDLDGAGGGEGSLELDGTGEDELEVDGGGAADGGGLLLEGGGGAAEEELDDDMTATQTQEGFDSTQPRRHAIGATSSCKEIRPCRAHCSSRRRRHDELRPACRVGFI